MSKSVLDLLPVAPKGNIDYNRIRDIQLNRIQDCKKNYLEQNGWGKKEGKNIEFYYNTAMTVDGKEKVKEHMKSCIEAQKGGKRRRKESKMTKKKMFKKEEESSTKYQKEAGACVIMAR